MTGVFLTPSQLMSLLLIVGGCIVLLYNKKVILRKLHARMDEYKELRPKDSDWAGVEILKVIKQLRKMADKGLITEEEYIAKKNDLLNRL